MQRRCRSYFSVFRLVHMFVCSSGAVHHSLQLARQPPPYRILQPISHIRISRFFSRPRHSGGCAFRSPSTFPSSELRVLWRQRSTSVKSPRDPRSLANCRGLTRNSNQTEKAEKTGVVGPSQVKPSFLPFSPVLACAYLARLGLSCAFLIQAIHMT